MPSLDDLMKKLLAERTQSSTQVFTNPLSGQPTVRMSPDRFMATEAQIDPFDFNISGDHETLGLTPNVTAGDPYMKNLGLQYLGIKPEQNPSFVNKFTPPEVATHEGVHQLLGDLGDKLGLKYWKQIDPMVKEAQDKNSNIDNYDEYPAYLFANPREIFDDPQKARATQLQYLEQLKKLSPTKAASLSGLVIRGPNAGQ